MMRVFYAVLVMGLSLLAILPVAQADDDDTQGGANIGERLFLETRFSEFFFTNSAGNANAPFTNGDPVMNTTASIYGPLPGPFAGQAMNCRACHLVEEQESTGNRTYCDFAQRSPVPDIGDGQTNTPRNAMPLVDALLARPGPLFLHSDGQFASAQDLIMGTLTGRNFGWKPTEYTAAIHHIAHIIRDDDGSGGLAQQYGGWSYMVTFEGLAEVQSQYAVLPQNRMNVSITDTNDPNYVTDDQIVQNIASLIQQYLETLVFSQDTNTGAFNGSPYDVFLAKNGLPQQPDDGESQLQYNHRLLRLVAALANPQYVSDPADGQFITNVHGQSFQFASNELVGLQIFLTDLASADFATNLQRQGVTAGVEVGNCATCHSPPAFSDFIFHNDGAAQEEYDAVHGAGAFAKLDVPALCARQSNYDAYLPPTPNHPNAAGNFETPPVLNNPALADLGLWNVFANPDFPAPQPGLQQILPQLLSVPSPGISAFIIQGSQFVFSGTNGVPGWPFYVLTSSDSQLPLADWTIIATNNFDSSGNFSFTNAVVPGASQAFFALSLEAIAPDIALPHTIALFKTPTVRDLVSSEPYLHTGRMNTIEDVLQFYLNVSANARAGLIRNADPQLSGIQLDASAIAPLAAFLRALNEADYADIPCPCQ
jgi:hypothetical protein